MLINSFGQIPANVACFPDAPQANTATAAAGAGVTLTIPAAGANVFNYLMGLTIQKTASALLTAAATPVTVTTTGIGTALSIDFDQAADAQGNTVQFSLGNSFPIKGNATNTAITIVCPATTAVIWRVTAWWQTATN